jgi:Mce-associated membrane protein
MADKDASASPDSGATDSGATDTSSTTSLKKVPSGKTRRAKPAVTVADTAGAPAASNTKQPKQITLSVSAIGKVVAGALVVALIALAVFFALEWKSDRDRIAAAEDAKQASDYFVTQLLNSMNTATAGEYVDTMSPLTTGQFRDNLVEEREKTQSDITQMQLRITPKIWSSGVVSSTEDSATTLIIAEITGTSSVATTPVTNIGMFRLTLEKHDGRWLVSQMDPGPASSGSGSADQPVDPNVPVDPVAPVDPNAGATTEPAPAPAPAG